jgi:hypothetical protein
MQLYFDLKISSLVEWVFKSRLHSKQELQNALITFLWQTELRTGFQSSHIRCKIPFSSFEPPYLEEK